jgi:uncharacterized OB-fold protein
VTTSPPPHPIPDADTAPFLDALREHRVVLQCCTECGRVRFPPMPACPWCGATTATRITASGNGRVYSWVGVQRALTPGFEDEVPYTIATVELDEGARVFGRLEGPEPTAPGGAVSAMFVEHEDWTELRFRPKDATP